MGDENQTQALALGERVTVRSTALSTNSVTLLQEILLAVEAILSPVPNRSAFITGQHNVRTSGQSEQLPNIHVPDGFTLVIKAHKSNTGTVTVGATSGAAQNTSQDNWKLAANESVKLAITNLNLVYLDVTVSGEGVEFIVEQ